MKIEFLGPIERPDPDLIKRVEEGGPYNAPAELLLALGFLVDQHRLIRVFADGDQVRFKDSIFDAQLISLMLTVGGG